MVSMKVLIIFYYFSLLTFLQEKSALKKLDGIKNEHTKRLDALKSEQEIDIHKARLIELNLPMVSWTFFLFIFFSSF